MASLHLLDDIKLEIDACVEAGIMTAADKALTLAYVDKNPGELEDLQHMATDEMVDLLFQLARVS